MDSFAVHKPNSWFNLKSCKALFCKPFPPFRSPDSHLREGRLSTAVFGATVYQTTCKKFCRASKSFKNGTPQFKWVTSSVHLCLLCSPVISRGEMGSWCDFVWAPPVLKLSWATGRGKTRETLKLCCLEFLAPLIMHEMCIRVISQGFILYKLLHVVWDIKCCSLNQQYHLLVNPGTVNFWSSNISKTGCCFLVNQPTPCFVSKLAKTDAAIDMLASLVCTVRKWSGWHCFLSVHVLWDEAY